MTKEPKPQPRRLIPWYRNERVVGNVTSSQVALGYVLIVTAALVALCVVAYVAYREGVDADSSARSAKSAASQANDAASQAKSLAISSNNLRIEGKKERLEAQARTDEEVARLACVVVEYVPAARHQLLAGLTTSQRALLADCSSLIASTQPPSSTAIAGPSPSTPAYSGGNATPSSSPAPSSPGRTTAGSPTSSPASPSASPSSSALLGPVSGILCGVLHVGCP